jgi:DNA-binding CsgD family transcriptional regulator
MEMIEIMTQTMATKATQIVLLTEIATGSERDTPAIAASRTAPRRDGDSAVLAGTTHRNGVPGRVPTEMITALQDAARAATVAAERARSVATVLDAALALVAAAQVSRTAVAALSDRSPGRALLSPREQEVLALVAAGRTNKAIAVALFVSPNTVKTHVASLLTKLRASRRVQLAAIAAQLRLRETVQT